MRNFRIRTTRPTSTAELEPAERLIVWAFRRWVFGLRRNTGEHLPLVWREFETRFGPCDSQEALSGFVGLINGLQCFARRKFCHHQPCCPCLGADEVRIVDFVAACQHRHMQLTRTMAEWMVESDAVGELIDNGRRVAQVLRRHGLLLPMRRMQAEPGVSHERAARPAMTMH